MNSFKIKSVKAFNVSLGELSSYWENYKKDKNSLLTKRFSMKDGWQTIYANHVQSVIVRSELDDGTVGWGEPNTPIAPEVVALLANDVISEVLVGMEFEQVGDVSKFISKLQSGRGYFLGYWQDLIAAIDISIWDAIGKRDKFRVFEELNFSPQHQLPVYLSGLRQESLTKRIDKLISMMNEGLKGVKIFFSDEIEGCLKEVEELQKFGSEITDFMVDMLWSCDYDAAKMLKIRLGDMGVKFLECPLQPEDLDGHKQLIQEHGTKIALGEHFRSTTQVKDWLYNRAVDIVQPDIGRTGITGFIEIKKECDTYGIPVAIHMGNGLMVFQAATLSCAASYEQEYLQEFQEGLANQFSINSEVEWRFHRGDITASGLYGIGVNDENIIQLINRFGKKT